MIEPLHDLIEPNLLAPFWRIGGVVGFAKDDHIHLVTPEAVKRTPAEGGLPKGTVLFDIMAHRVVVGEDRIDQDTRGGYLAYGLLCHRPKCLETR